MTASPAGVRPAPEDPRGSRFEYHVLTSPSTWPATLGAHPKDSDARTCWGKTVAAAQIDQNVQPSLRERHAALQQQKEPPAAPRDSRESPTKGDPEQEERHPEGDTPGGSQTSRAEQTRLSALAQTQGSSGWLPVTKGPRGQRYHFTCKRFTG